MRRRLLALIAALTLPLVAQVPVANGAPGQLRRAGGTTPLADMANLPTPRMADGTVDLWGTWVGGGPVNDIAAGLKEGEELPMLPWAKALRESRTNPEDPHNFCLPMGVPRQAGAFPWRFVRYPTHEAATHLFILWEGFRNYRQIFMDGRPHSDDPTPTWFGESIGSWDGDTLVIDSIGFNDKFWWARAGTPHTEQLHIVERWTRVNFATLNLEVTIDDPGAFSRPFTLYHTARHSAPGDELKEYICEENNQFGLAGGHPNPYRADPAPERRTHIVDGSCRRNVLDRTTGEVDMRCTSKKACQRRASKTLVGATLLLVVAAGHLPARVDAQSAAAPAQIPDLSETWARLGPLPGRPNAPLVPTARAIGFGLAFDEVLSPRYDCSPVSAPLILLDPFNFQIEQQADRVILRYEKDDVVRTVWLEGHGHPEPGAYDYTIQGHSIGRYENNQLVVVTSKFVFEPTGLDEPRHIPSSTLKKVTERYWREGDRLKVEVTTEDPLTLLKPFEFTWEWERTELPLERYDCDPEDARYPAKFHGSTYQDPDWVRLPVASGQEP